MRLFRSRKLFHLTGEFWKKAPDDLEGVVCSDAGPCFPSVITLHGPHSGLLRCILSPWCYGVNSDRVVVV